MLEVKNLSVKYGGFNAVNDLSFTVEDGQWLMLVGPNGAGKSTVLGAISQTVPHSGTISYNGENLREMKPAVRASKIGVLAQNHFVGYSFSVEEVVRLGRYSHSGGFFSRKDTGDEAAIEKALELTGLTGLRKQSVLTLSGGELQRAFLAQVLAQDPRVLLLDEPTNHLDLIYQKQIFSLISEWLKEPGRAVVSVVHDLSLARLYGTHGILLHHGKAISSGLPDDVMKADTINSVYGMDVAEWMRTLLSAWPENESAPLRREQIQEI